MNLLSKVMIYILIASQKSTAADQQFMCTFDTFLAHVDLECPKDEGIHVLNLWTVALKDQLKHCGAYAKSSMLSKYSVTMEMTQKILRKCSVQQSCRVELYNDHYGSANTSAILIRYECVQAVYVIPFCQDTFPKRTYQRDVYLVDHDRDGRKDDGCICTVDYTGHAHISLSYVPTHSKYLEVTTWTNGREQTNQYNNGVYTNVTVAHDPDRQKFIVKNEAAKSEIEVTMTLVRIVANGVNSSFSLQCSRPVDEINRKTETTPKPMQTNTSKTRTIIVVSVVTALCILGFNICVFILYRRHVNKRNIDSGSRSGNKSSDTSDGTNAERKNTHTSVYVDCTGRLRSSYAEIGSLSESRHYATPDDTSLRSLRVTMHYETLAEEDIQPKGNHIHTQDIPHESLNNSGNNKFLVNKSGLKSESPTDYKTNVANEGKPGQQLNSEATGDMAFVGKEKKKATERSVSANRVKNDGNDCNRSTMTMLQREHYDLSGYLSLDVTENTSHVSLTKWKEIYSIEHAAREMCKDPLYRSNDPVNVERRNVTIHHQPNIGKPPGYPYQYADKHCIEFEEDELVFQPEDQHVDSTTHSEGKFTT